MITILNLRTEEFYVSDAGTNVDESDIENSYSELRMKRAMLDRIDRPDYQSVNNQGGSANTNNNHGNAQRQNNLQRNQSRKPQRNFKNKGRKQNRTHQQFQKD